MREESEPQKGSEAGSKRKATERGKTPTSPGKDRLISEKKWDGVDRLLSRLPADDTSNNVTIKNFPLFRRKFLC